MEIALPTVSFNTSLIVIIGLVIIVTVLAWMNFKEDPMRDRIVGIIRRVRDDGFADESGGGDSAVGRRPTLIGSILSPAIGLIVKASEAVNAKKSLGDKESEEIRSLLISAGWRAEADLSGFVVVKFGVALACLAIVALLLFVFDIFPDWGLPLQLGGLFGAAFIGAMIPNRVLKMLAEKRLEKIVRFLPDVTDMMIICIQAGLGFEETLNRIWREIASFAPDLSEELRVTALEYRLLDERSQALRNLSARIPVEEIQVLVMTVTQAEKYGTSMAQALAIMADEARKKRLSRAEAWAGRVPVLMTMPLVAFLMPVFMIMIAGPAVRNISTAFSGL